MSFFRHFKFPRRLLAGLNDTCVFFSLLRGRFSRKQAPPPPVENVSPSREAPPASKIAKAEH